MAVGIYPKHVIISETGKVSSFKVKNKVILQAFSIIPDWSLSHHDSHSALGSNLRRKNHFRGRNTKDKQSEIEKF